MKFWTFFIFVGHLCPPGSRSGSAIWMRIRIQQLKLMRIHVDPDPDLKPCPGGPKTYGSVSATQLLLYIERRMLRSSYDLRISDQHLWQHDQPGRRKLHYWWELFADTGFLFRILIISHPGSWIQQEQGPNKILFYLFISRKFTKLKLFYIWPEQE
jgi:hypothetical protein